MTVVVDSSVVIAALLDAGPLGRWAEETLLSGPLMVPHLMPVEAANILRRSALAESLQVPLATLDLRLACATGPRCGFVVPRG